MTIAAEGVTHHYGRRRVLDEAGFAAPARGPVTILIGPNAAGKSTLFKAIAGLVRPGVGRMLPDGADMARLSRHERARRIGFMPQVFMSNAALTVFEVVLLARKQLSGWRVGREDLAAVSGLLERMGIGHLARAHVGELSGGQGQMVSAAQALARQPEVFLFDEPTSALDLRRQLELLGLIAAETRARNIVTFVALHDLNLAARFGDAALLMSRGRILMQGAPEAVLSDPCVDATYGVHLDLIPHPKGGFHVSASL